MPANTDGYMRISGNILNKTSHREVAQIKTGIKLHSHGELRI